MTPLTGDQIKAYVARGAGECPYCHSDRIIGGPFETDVDAGHVFQTITCWACGRQWTDNYTLASLTPVRDHDPDESMNERYLESQADQDYVNGPDYNADPDGDEQPEPDVYDEDDLDPPEPDHITGNPNAYDQQGNLQPEPDLDERADPQPGIDPDGPEPTTYEQPEP